MDYKAMAEKALADRKTAWTERCAVLEDSTLTEAAKQERCAAIDADMKRFEDVAAGHLRDAEREDSVRDMQARLTALQSTARGEQRETRSGMDFDKEVRDILRGRRFEPIDLNIEHRIATVGTSNNAGTTVEDSFVATVIQAMRDRSQFFSLANVLPTRSGEQLDMPVKNGLNPATAIMTGAAQTAENTAFPAGNQTWSRVSLKAWKYGVLPEITRELVEDSALDLLSILAQDAGEAVADLVMTDLMVGAGTTEPWGFVTRAATSGVNAANLTGVTLENMLNLKYSLTAPYRQRGVYFCNDLLIPVLRTAKINSEVNHFAWQPSVQAGQPDTLHGSPILTDPNIATAGASAKVAVFGDPKKYTIRQVGSLRVSRSDEYGWDRDAIALKVVWRGDGDLLDTNAAKSLTVTA